MNSLLIARFRKLVSVLRVPAYRRALRHGTAAAVEHDSIPFRRDYRTVIDVGASRGQFALVARRRFPEASIVCIEPLPKPRAALERCLNGAPRLTVVAAAATTTSGEAEFTVSRADDSSSLLPITDLQVNTFPGTDPVAKVTVRTARLDEVVAAGEIRRPALLKVDVQGSELDALQGAGEVLDEVDTVLVECSFVEFYRGQAHADDVVRFLHDRGFRLEGIRPGHLDKGSATQADLLFERVND